MVVFCASIAQMLLSQPVSFNCLKPMVSMVFKLIKRAGKTWWWLDSKNQLPKFITGVKFCDGSQVIDHDSIAAWRELVTNFSE
jgi:hypothetical protein